MFRRSQQVGLLAVAVLLIAPALGVAQQAGPLYLDNQTGTTLRIGCQYYVNADGQRVNLNSFWTLSAGFNAKLTTPGGGDIVARKFVFFLITPDGESAGWTFDKINERGNLHLRIDAGTLANHRRLAAGRIRTSTYPPLTTGGLEVADVNAAIARAEQRLRELRIAIPVAQVALAAARAANNKVQNDPNANFGQVLAAQAAVSLAEAALDALLTERNNVQSNLSTNQTRLRALQARPD